MRRRVLVLTRDLIPLPGHAASGGGIRAWGLGEGLRARGHDVVYSVPRASVPEGEQHDELRQASFEGDDLHRCVLRTEPDVVLVEQWGLATYLQDVTVPLVIDLHGSLILENAFRRHRTVTSNAAAKIKALRKADLVICPAVRQRAYFMSWLMMSGAEPTAIPIEVVPVSLSPELPERGRPADDGPLTAVFGGQLWPWIVPEDGIRAVAEALESADEQGNVDLYVEEPTKLTLLPFDDSTQVHARPLARDITEHPRVRRQGMVGHDELLRRYGAAQLAVDLYAWNTERELAYTTRTVEYLWCGLPVLYGDYGELADPIREHEAGWVVPPGDPDAIRAAAEQAVGDREELWRRGENAQRLVRERLTWDRTIEPLERFVCDPVQRHKGRSIFGSLALEFDRIEAETRERSRELERNVAQLSETLAAREHRVAELNEALVARDHRVAELTEALGTKELRVNELLAEGARAAADGLRERQLLQEENIDLKVQLEQAGRLNHKTRKQLQREQGEHALAAREVEALRDQLVDADNALQRVEADKAALQVDLKGSVERLAHAQRESTARIETLEHQLRETSERELAARSDLGQLVGERDALKRQGASLQQDLGRARQKIEQLRNQLQQMRQHWLNRTVETGQHSVRRVAVQVPALAGLFVRNLANNAYMTIWQKRHNVRIFPGQ